MKKIKIELSEDGIDDLIKRLDDFKHELQDLSDPVRQLCEMGEKTADQILTNALSNFDGVRQGSVTSNVSGNSGEIVMDGPGVAFIEFGAGVYFNGSGNYPLPRPAGIVGIGQYGQGQGMHDMWRYGGKWTHGTPASKPMYFAALRAEQNAPAVFRKMVEDAFR